MADAKPIKWDHIQRWRTRIYGDRKQVASVEVCRWSFRQPEDDDFDGEYVWNVYAKVWPEHPLFAELSKAQDYWNCEAISAMPLHGGCTHMQSHYDKTGAIAFIEVGCDYNHLHDGYFRRNVTREDAHEVFSDAEVLVQHLEKAYAAKATGSAHHG